MSDTSLVFLISLLIIIAGFLLKKFNIIHPEDGKALSRIVLNFTFPALILTKIRKMPLDTSVIYLPVICFCFCLILMIIGAFVFKSKPAKEKGLLLMTMGGFNIGLFAFPIIEGIWGAKGLQYIAMFDIGNALIILGVGYFIGDYYSPLNTRNSKPDFKYVMGLFLKSLPFMSYFIALLLNFLSIPVPLIADTFLETVSKANMPLVLLLLGVYFNLNVNKNNVSEVLQVILIRYIPGLAIGLLLFFLLPFNLLYRTMILIGLTLPIGLSIIPFSDKFGYNTGFAASLTNISLVISFVLMWIIVAVTTG